ncbi:MAG: outer membrane beta-barrel protein [Bacteroides sp.]|nr:outer membrane beta-barrel protein [Bacteroides sp.]
MKKLFGLAVIALAFAGVNVARAGGVYEGVASGRSVWGLRLGLSKLVGVNVTYDYALARVWKGSFTIGGQLGYMWNGDNGKVSKWADNYIDFKVRTTYRFNVVVPEWEVYGGVGLGGAVKVWTIENKSTKAKDSGSKGYLSGSFIAGTAYHFTRNISVNLELDFGNFEQAWVNLGVNYIF